MDKERLMQILLEPRMTEKAATVADRNRQYTFKVRQDANKIEIKAAVEELFDVQVASVQTCNVTAKSRRFRGRLGVRSGWKKAYVKLKEGFDIDYAGAE